MKHDTIVYFEGSDAFRAMPLLNLRMSAGGKRTIVRRLFWNEGGRDEYDERLEFLWQEKTRQL
jgi:hypothetical protein